MSDLGLTQPAPQAGTTQLVEEKLRLEQRFKGGAGWFYWIAGLSMVNTISLMVGSTWGFIFGLGITSLIAAVAAQLGTVVLAIGFTINAVIAGLLIFFGYQAQQRKKWAFFVGMALYGLDGCISLLVGDWIGVGVHGLVLFFVYQGLAAFNEMIALEARSENFPIPAAG